jgi:hypothetical protein
MVDWTNIPVARYGLSIGMVPVVGVAGDRTAQIIMATAGAIFIVSHALLGLPRWMGEMLSFYEQLRTSREERACADAGGKAGAGGVSPGGGAGDRGDAVGDGDVRSGADGGG